MNKTTKKLEANLVRALTIACEQAKVEIAGFNWLTHTADYANFPGSLLVRCIFDTNQSLIIAKDAGHCSRIVSLVQKQLIKAGILLKTPKRHVLFDSEEACESQHQGNWKKRIDEKH